MAGTHGARELLDNLTAYALLPAGPGSIVIGCAGGKHRACALVEIFARRIYAQGRRTETRHLHARLPRVLTPPTVA